MRPDGMRSTKSLARAATLAVAAMAIDLALLPGIAQAAKASEYYVDGRKNVCVGNEDGPGFCDWEGKSEKVTGPQNTAVGSGALFSLTEGNSNTASGAFALSSDTTGINNTATGVNALVFNTTGEDNTASGENALGSNKKGSGNVAIGASAGSRIEGSNNVAIANEGTEEDEKTIRIGAEKTQTSAFVAGIFSTEVSGCFVQVTKEGQLGCNPKGEAKEGKVGKEGPAGKEGKEGKEGKPGAEGKEGKPGAPGASNAAIATFASFENVASGRCLNYTEVGDPGTASCPSKTSGFYSGRLLAGPTPAGGATVSNLYVDSNASVSGKDSVLVAVIENTTGTTLLPCTVNSTNKNSCSNTGSSGPVAAGDNIEVKLTASGSSGNNKQWRVRFRY